MRLGKAWLVMALLLVAFGLTGGVMSSVGPTQQEINLEKGLVKYWMFDEGEGDIAFDETENHNDGGLLCIGEGCSQSKWVEGKIGTGLEFDGDDYVDCGNDSSLEVTETFTIQAWIKKTVSGAMQAILAKCNCSALCDYLVGSKNSKLQFGGPQGLDPRGVLYSFDPNDGEWHYVVAVWGGGECSALY